MNAGWTGIVVALIFSLTGILLGLYHNFKYAPGVRERNIMNRTTIAIGCANALFLMLLVSLPTPYRRLVWIPYLGIIAFIIAVGKRAVKKYRQPRENEVEQTPPEP